MSYFFDVDEWKELISDDYFMGFKTPLGNIELRAEIGNVDLSYVTCTAAFQSDCGYLFRWLNEKFVVELLIKEEVVRIPEDMHVDACWSARWRVQAQESIQVLFFYCKWKPGYKWTKGGSDSGEWFDAQTYQNDRYMITVLTEDAYKLELRAKNNDWMPDRLVNRFIKETDREIVDYHIESNQEEFKVIVPDLLFGEKCQVNYSMAWVEYKRPDDVSTWYAADVF